MIVRINQLDASTAESATGWDAGTATGPIERHWSKGTSAYQLLILDFDEQKQPVGNSARRDQIQQMLPQVIDALTLPQDRVVIRMDGPFNPGGVAPAFAFAADWDRCTRFSFGSADQLADRTEPPIVSIRLFPRPHHLAELCTDPRILLHQTVRLRAFGLPEDLVDPMLDTADLDDERWRDLFPRLGFMVSTSHDLLSLLIWTSRFEADEVRSRITERLGGKERAIDSLATAQWK